jgi:hypothetical protein
MTLLLITPVTRGLRVGDSLEHRVIRPGRPG